MAFFKKIRKSIKKRGRSLKKSIKKRSRRGGGISRLARSGGLGRRGRKTIKKRGGGFGKRLRSALGRRGGRKGGIGSLFKRRFNKKFQPLINDAVQQAAGPNQGQSAAMAAQSQFMKPQITPEMQQAQQAAMQMQQGMNQGTNEGGFAGDPYDDPIKYTGQDMTPQETQRLQNKMRAHAMRMGTIKPPMDISVAEPAGQQAPQGLQDFMDQKIDPRQQGQFANLPPAEQMKYMQGMSGQPQRPPQMVNSFGPQPYQMRPQQAMSDFERQEMEMNGRRAGGSAHTMGGLMFNPATALVHPVRTALCSIP